MKYKLLVLLQLCLPLTAYSAEVKVQERILNNGLKILVKEDHRSPVVVSQIWYKVGSSYEPGGITGASHMLEHMMFKGTEKHPAGEFSRIIAENGGDENAFTSRDYTAYFQTMEKSRLPVSFELEADRMRNLRLSPEELKKELEVVYEERRMRTEDKPRAKVEEYFMAMAFTSSPYKHPVIGWPSDIENYTVPDLQAWYERWYAPNNATLVVVGDVQPEEVFALAQKFFGEIKTSELKPLKPQTEMPQVGERRMTLKVPAKLPYILLGYKVPSLKTAEQPEEAYALEVLAGVLDGGNSARLSSQLVRGKQIASSAGAGYDLSSRLSELFLLDATPAKDKTLADMEKALKAEITKLQNELISAEELQRIKAQVLAQAVYQHDSMFYQGMQLGIYETVGLGWQKADQYVENINKVTPEQVQAVAKKYLVDEHLNVAYMEPQNMVMPANDAHKHPAQ
jgi:zinc protease